MQKRMKNYVHKDILGVDTIMKTITIAIAIAIAIVFLFVLQPFYSNADITDYLFYDKKYSKQITVETYLVNEKQISDLFIGEGIEQPTFENLSKENLYLVVRLKNIGLLSAWGELVCKVAGSKKHLISVEFLRSSS